MKVGDYVTFRTKGSLGVQLGGITKARVIRIGDKCGYRYNYNGGRGNDSHVATRLAVVCVEGYGSATDYTNSNTYDNWVHQPTKIGPGTEFIVAASACEITTEHDVEPQFRTASSTNGGYEFRSPPKDVLDFLLAAG